MTNINSEFFLNVLRDMYHDNNNPKITFEKLLQMKDDKKISEEKFDYIIKDKAE